MKEKVRELEAFIGLTVLMGIVEKPSITDYWNIQNPSINTPFFRETMSLQHYQLLLRYFHIADNEHTPPSPIVDRFYKVRSAIDHFNICSRHHYQPNQLVAVDESIVGFRGHHSAIQFLPNKRHHRFGPKLWILADISGYSYKIAFYQGKNNTAVSRKGLGFDVTIDLTTELRGKGYHVFTDSFYTSPQLFNDLFDEKTVATGTIRSNRRGFPRCVRDAPGNTTTYARKGPLLAVKYRDKNRNVMFLSTAAAAGDRRCIPQAHHRQAAGAVTRPIVVSIYNRGKGAVDTADLKVEEYTAERATMKLWKKVLFHLVDRMLLNAFIVYEESVNPEGRLSRKSFIISVVESLCSAQRTMHMQKTRRSSTH